ncbi:Zinc finger, PHD-finger,Zinc finger, PHD-type,Zinc finger, RING/FYVE/PHD-type,Zinc finger, PHD- [Cinara cedri]|uniref:Zinc finger, PHD-finger,Zinc finger, PHD-type,Zinc finger, RING/FYVE/PHD-type,Zinc finger, PHD n=1 Tax=Cinara cedri TaxID=506608 RepID=A0A5E4NT09_9HEMI|nr:Zinc finger, PHD-finger,Zinc finger, PHD-type,Zinc finger, RING/FYVE/PHD-type,Zinc finger, PHD- [Cinara cedri]
MRNFDLEFQQMMTKVNNLTQSFKGNLSSANVAKLSNLLVTGLDIGDRKILTMQKTSSLVEDKLMRLEISKKEYLTSIKEPKVPNLRIKDKQKTSSCSKERRLPSESTSTATKELKNRNIDSEPNNGLQISKRPQRNKTNDPDYTVISDNVVVNSSLNRHTPLPRATATAQLQSQVTFKQTTQKTEKSTKKKLKFKKNQKYNSPSTDDDKEITVDLEKRTKMKRKYKKQEKYDSPSSGNDEEIPVDFEKQTKQKRKYRIQRKDNPPLTNDNNEIPIVSENPTKMLCKYKRKQIVTSPSTNNDEKIPVDRVKQPIRMCKYKKQQKYDTSSMDNDKEIPVDIEKQTKQKRKYKKQGKDNSPQTDDKEILVDPDEPTYCLCDQISYGEMICCDNDLCPLEWFHFSCVSLSTKPKGKWFCPKCRGDRTNIMKPKAQFLKELELYNKEKEA